jgi:signal peptidase II
MPKNNFKKIIFFILVASAIFALDRITKFSPEKCFSFICAERTINKGAALSLFSNFSMINPVLIAVAFAVLFLTAFFYFRIKKFGLLHVGLALLFAGTLGNLIDRISFSYVIDFIKFSFLPIFPAFNLADVANVIGALLLIIALLRK